MPQASKGRNGADQIGLVEKLQELGASALAEALPHLVEHDASAIEHPLWPVVSYVGRDHTPGLFEKLNPFFIVCRRSEDPPVEDAKYLVEAQMRIIGGVMNFAGLLQLKNDKYFNDFEMKEESPDMRLGEVVFNFLYRPVFAPLIFAVSEAKGHPKFWFPFVASSRLDGFLENVMAISQITAKGNRQAKIDYSILNAAETHEASFILREYFKESAPATAEEMTELCSSWMKAKQAEDRRRQRHLEGVEPRQNACRDLILTNWLTDALWCRTTAGIVSRYDNTLGVKDADDHEAVCSRMEKEISKLNLSADRRSEHNEVIEKAEKIGFSQLSKS